MCYKNFFALEEFLAELLRELNSILFNSRVVIFRILY